MAKQALMIGDKVEVTERHGDVWSGVLSDLDKEYAYVTRGQESHRRKVPRELVRSLAERTPEETQELFANPIEVYAPWHARQWHPKRFPTMEAAEAALAELRDMLPASYVQSQNDPLITVGTYGRRGWTW